MVEREQNWLFVFSVAVWHSALIDGTTACIASKWMRWARWRGTLAGDRQSRSAKLSPALTRPRPVIIGSGLSEPFICLSIGLIASWLITLFACSVTLARVARAQHCSGMAAQRPVCLVCATCVHLLWPVISSSPQTHRSLNWPCHSVCVTWARPKLSFFHYNSFPLPHTAKLILYTFAHSRHSGRLSIQTICLYFKFSEFFFQFFLDHTNYPLHTNCFDSFTFAALLFIFWQNEKIFLYMKQITHFESVRENSLSSL